MYIEYESLKSELGLYTRKIFSGVKRRDEKRALSEKKTISLTVQEGEETFEKNARFYEGPYNSEGMRANEM